MKVNLENLVTRKKEARIDCNIDKWRQMLLETKLALRFVFPETGLNIPCEFFGDFDTWDGNPKKRRKGRACFKCIRRSFFDFTNNFENEGKSSDHIWIYVNPGHNFIKGKTYKFRGIPYFDEQMKVQLRDVTILEH